MTDDDLAYMQWANKRYSWLWRYGWQRTTWKPLRVATANTVALLIRADRFWWRHLRRT